mgnify:CR=1 FL=1
MTHASARPNLFPTSQATAPAFRCAPLRRGPLRWRRPLWHTREDTGPGRLSARRPPPRAALSGLRSSSRPGCVPPVPETSRGPIAVRITAASDEPEIGTPACPPDIRNTPTDTASHCINLVAGSSIDALACLLRTLRRHTREDSGTFLASLLRPPTRASCVGTAPAIGSLGSARPETSRGPIRFSHLEQLTGVPPGIRLPSVLPAYHARQGSALRASTTAVRASGATGLCPGVLTGREIGLAEIPGTVPESDHARSREIP